MCTTWPSVPAWLQDTPVENALIFHHRVKRFMQQHITASAKSHRCAGQHKGILGRVLHLLTRYEVQSRCAGGGPSGGGCHIGTSC